MRELTPIGGPFHLFAFGDLHAPWAKKSAVEQALEILDRYHRKVLPVSHVVQIGDAYDMYSWNRFGVNQNILTPKEEIYEARKFMKYFWSAVHEIVGSKSRKLQLLGNHDVRPHKKVMKDSGNDTLFEFDSMFRFPGVETVLDAKEEVVLKDSRARDIWVQHGHYPGIGRHMKYNHARTVHGHTHKAGITTERIKGETLWELDAGFLADPYAEPLNYRQQRKHNWTHSVARVTDDGPSLIFIDMV